MAAVRKQTSHAHAPLPYLPCLQGTEDERTVAEQLQAKIDACNRAMEDALANVQQTWEEKVAEMERASPIKSKELLWNSSIVLAVVIILFFVHSIPSIHLGLGWIAVLGVCVCVPVCVCVRVFALFCLFVVIRHCVCLFPCSPHPPPAASASFPVCPTSQVPFASSC